MGTVDRTWTSASGDSYRLGLAVKDISEHVEQDGGERTKDGGIATRRAQARQTRARASYGAVRHIESSGRPRPEIGTPTSVRRRTSWDRSPTSLAACGGVERRGGGAVPTCNRGLRLGVARL